MSTTTNKRRLEVASNDSNKRRGAEDNTKGVTGTEEGADTDHKPKASSTKAAHFSMKRWDPNDFFGFLNLANSDMTGLTISAEDNGLASLNAVRRFYKTMTNGSMEDKEVGNESIMEGYMMTRFGKLEKIFASCQLPEEYKELFFGQKCEMKQKSVLSVGPDSASDMIFVHIRPNGNNHVALVPMENKVPWNFPGGSLTSSEKDFARLGRDLKLYDLKPDTPVTSRADRDTTGQIDIGNPHEGEDHVEAMPEEANGESAANSSVPTHSKSRTYTMKHNVFPLEVTDDGKLVVHIIAGPFWSLKQLNTYITEDQGDEGKRIATEYYTHIHKYPDTQVSICDPDAWTTNIGEYPFLVGLFCFLFAASVLVDCRDGQESKPYNDGDHEDDGIHAEDGIDEDDGDHGNDDNSCSNQQLRPQSCMRVSEMLRWRGESLWKPAPTRSGPLTLAELEGGKPRPIGSGRIGDAVRAKLGILDIACKLLCRSSWNDEDYNTGICELKHEEQVYNILCHLQGVVIPRFFVYDQAFADLAAVHDAGVVHGDLELRNLVFDGEKIKLIDFGNALLQSEYGSDIESLEKDKEKDLRQLRLILSWIRPLQEKGEAQFAQDKDHTQECAPVNN